MGTKELNMERFDAGREMQEQVRRHKEQGAAPGPSELEKLLNSHEQVHDQDDRPMSLSQEKYPEAYRGGVEEHWTETDLEHQRELIRRQAIANEKVGYEDDTEKFFMDDPDAPRHSKLSAEERLRVFGKTEEAIPLESLNGPPLVFGGMLMGICLTLIVLMYVGMLEVANPTNWYVFSGIGATVGLMYAAQLRT